VQESFGVNEYLVKANMRGLLVQRALCSLPFRVPCNAALARGAKLNSGVAVLQEKVIVSVYSSVLWGWFTIVRGDHSYREFATLIPFACLVKLGLPVAPNLIPEYLEVYESKYLSVFTMKYCGGGVYSYRFNRCSLPVWFPRSMLGVPVGPILLPESGSTREPEAVKGLIRRPAAFRQGVYTLRQPVPAPNEGPGAGPERPGLRLQPVCTPHIDLAS